MVKIESSIYGIFPYPVYTSVLKNTLSKEKINKALKLIKDNPYKNSGNFHTTDTYVLNKNYFKKLKKELEEIVKDYFNKIICPKYDIQPYITQSWLNSTGEGNFHHKHAHPNSVVSGVLYFSANPEYDKIFFSKDKYEQISIEKKEFNLYNSSSWFFPIKKDQVILFPSDLQHHVETKKENNLRLSLAFNVFIKGKLGETMSLTELILK
jgi:uncharacterized protein (TIGR02466 family)